MQTQEARERLMRYCTETENEFASLFLSNAARFQDYEKLIGLFKGRVSDFTKNGTSEFHAIEETHNELCIANWLLADPSIVEIKYEPPINPCKKTIDFLAIGSNEDKFYVDIKTITPKNQNDWNNYTQEKAHIAENVNVSLSENCLGGEIYHNMKASRSKFIEYTQEFEAKIREGNLPENKSRFVLMLCGTGFHWHCDELEDYVNWYFTGEYSYDDPFSKMQNHNLTTKNIKMDKSINSFACMKREQLALHQSKTVCLNP